MCRSSVVWNMAGVLALCIPVSRKLPGIEIDTLS
jgi:hypothetical protein